MTLEGRESTSSPTAPWNETSGNKIGKNRVVGTYAPPLGPSQVVHYEKTDPSYVRPPSFFQMGRIFAVLFTEAAGGHCNKNTITTSAYQRPSVTAQTQRFIVVRKRDIGVMLSSGLATLAALDVGKYRWAWSRVLRAQYYHEGYTSSGISDPFRGSASHTTVSTMVFTASTVAISYLRHDDEYQDDCLFAGMMLGIGIGLYMDKSLEGIILQVFPWAILSALLCSMLLHMILRKLGGGSPKHKIMMGGQDEEKCLMSEE